MEVKELINKIKVWRSYYLSEFKKPDCDYELNEVISLLQELEKYKRMYLTTKIAYDEVSNRLMNAEKHQKMWGELKKTCGELFMTTTHYPLCPKVIWETEHLERKYFPISVKKTITIEVEGKDVGWVIESFKDDVKNINREYKNIKVNIKEEK